VGNCVWANGAFYNGDYVEVMPYLDAGLHWGKWRGRRGIVVNTFTNRRVSFSIALVEVLLDGDSYTTRFEDGELRRLTVLDLLAEIT
jgi:hypothetical protein